ncbi:MAG: peptide deformylase [Lentisphaerae bacterium]|nr:peptide deformylase [Lentisphaerota bacterium]
MFKFGKKKSLTMKYLGEACLHQKAARIEEITDDVRSLGEAMLEVMYKQDGVGLAAPQVGISLRLVTLDVPEPKEPGMPLSPGERELLPQMPMVLVNPEIESFSAVTEVGEEGCLSVPKLYAPVERPVSVVLKTTLLDGRQIRVDCGGFLARALQHELDHLDGVVYVQRVKDPDYAEILPQLQKIYKKYGPKGYKINRLV